MLNLANNMVKKLQTYFLNNWLQTKMDFRSVSNIKTLYTVYTLIIKWLNEIKEQIKKGENECK